MNWWALSTIIVSVILVPTTVVLVIKLATRRKPAWAWGTEYIIGKGADAPEGLEVTFDKVPVESVFRTRLIFFNNGKKDIVIGDIPDNERITIRFEGDNILREPITGPFSRPTINFRAYKQPHNSRDSIELDFTNLKYGDGGVVEVLHTEGMEPRLFGSVRDVDKIHYIGQFIPYSPIDWWATFKKRDNLIGFFLVAGWLIAMLLLAIKEDQPESLWIFAGFFIFVAIIVLRWYRRKRKFPEWTCTTRD